MQSITVKITKGQQLKTCLRPGIQGSKGAEGLQGEQGIPGIDGLPGINGQDGKDGQDGQSAYQIALENGFIGTEQEWILSLKGEKGDTGEQGLQGAQGEQGLKGDKGDAGDSGIIETVAPLQYVSETKTLQIDSGYIIPSNSGDGTKYLTDDGTFKTVSIPSGAKIEVGDSKAEITDTGSNGLFSVITDNITRIKVNEDFHFGDGNTEWASGTEYKCFFDKSKGALRAGLISNTEWNDSYRGLYSTAFGTRTKASGDNSFACGYRTVSSASTSFACGYNITVSGNYSTGIGYFNTVSGSSAFGCGEHTTASGSISFSAGYYNTANSELGTTFGANNTSNGFVNTFIIGQGASANIHGAFIRSLGDSYISPIAGGAQIESVPMAKITTDEIPTGLAMQYNKDRTGGIGITIPAKSCWTYKVTVTAFKNDYSESAAFELKGQIKRDNSNNTTLIWSNNNDVNKVLYRDNSGWDINAAVDTGSIIVFYAIGAALTTIKWCADITFMEVKF